MKKLAFVLIIAVFAIGSAFAQPGGGGFGGDPAQRIQREVDGLKTELGLSADQVTKVTAIVTAAQAKQREEMQKMRDGGGGDFDPQKFMEMRQKAQAETDTQLKAVLTPEQAPKLEAYRKKQQEEMQRRMQGN